MNHRWPQRARIALLPTLVAVGLGCAVPSQGGRDSDYSSGAETSAPYSSSSGSSSQASVSGVPSGPRNSFGVFTLPRNRKYLEDLDGLGVGWVRLQNQMGETAVDRGHGDLIRRGYGILLTLHHRDPSNVFDRRAFDATKRGSFPPKNLRSFTELIHRTLAPLVDALREEGKRPGDWLVVQFGNEVVPNDYRPDNPKRFWHGSMREFLATQAAAYDAIKALDPEIRVALSGMASEMLDHCIGGTQRVEDLGRVLLTEAKFDVVDMHVYNRIDDIPEKVRWVRQYWDGPIVATETGGPDKREGGKYSEAAHARDVERRVQTLWDNGVQWIFWSFLKDIDIPDDPVSGYVGLLTQEGERKPGYDVYRDFVARHGS